MSADANSRFESQGPVSGGVNSGYPPFVIGTDAVSWAVNASFRGLYPVTRPKFVHRATLPTGKMQGARFFDTAEGAMVGCIDGRLYHIFVSNDTLTLADVTPLSGRNSKKVPIAYIEQAERHIIVQDGQSRPMLYDGGVARRAVDDEVPVGTHTAYGNGRIFVAFGREVLAGDLVGLSPTSHLKFTETTYLAEGGAFSFPGKVTGLEFLPRLDDATETGDLLVFTQRSTSAIRSSIFDRTLWKQTPSMQRLVFGSVGCASGYSVTPVNQDLYFRSIDGVRSLRNTFSDQQDNGNTPVSKETERLFNHDSGKWLEYETSVYFKNWLLVACNPRIIRYTEDHDGDAGFNVVPQSLAVLDFAQIASMRGEGAPAWSGEWTGLGVKFMVRGVFQGRERLFLFCVACDGTSHIYEMVEEEVSDISPDGRVPVTAAVETRTFNFGTPFSRKELVRGDFFFSEIWGPLDRSFQFRQDRNPCWVDWRDATGPDIAFESTGENPVPTLEPGWRYSANDVGRPAETCTTLTRKQAHNAYEFQFRIEWTGHARLDRFRVQAQLQDTSNFALCDEA